MSNHKWIAERDRLIELITDGVLMVEIAEQYGVSRQRLDQVVNKLGLRRLVKDQYAAYQTEIQRLMVLTGCSRATIRTRLLNYHRGTLTREQVELPLSHRGRRASEQTIDDMVDMFVNGLTITLIAEKTSYAVMTVSDYLRERGVDTQANHYRYCCPKMHDPHTKELVLSLLSKGKSLRAIAYRLRVSNTTMYKYARIWGIIAQTTDSSDERV